MRIMHDFGHDWRVPSGQRGRLTWNPANGELVMEYPNGVSICLAIIYSEHELRRRLDGWAEHCGTREGLGWLAQRLEGCR